MSGFDMALCLDESTLNGIIAALFGRQSLKERLFTGSEPLTVAGAEMTASWNVTSPPTVSLRPPTNEQWSQAVKRDGTLTAPAVNALCVHFPQMIVRKTVSGNVAETTTAFDAICTVGLAGPTLTIDPLAVVIDLSSASKIDSYLYRNLLIPRVLTMVGTLLSGRQLPQLELPGLTFGPFTAVVGEGLLAAVANLQGKPQPQAPSLQGLPGGRFSVLVSPEVMQRMADHGTSSLQGKNVGVSGSQSFGIGKANYSANVRINRISSAVEPSDPTTLAASVGVQISAGAGVDIIDVISDAFKSY